MGYLFGKKTTRKSKVYLILFFIVILTVICVLIFNSVILPILSTVIEAKVLSLITSAINNSVFLALTEKTTYNELISIYKDNDGNITMIQANTVKINTLARETSRLSQERINKLGEEGIDIALGTLIGSPLLVGQGPMIHFKMMPVGFVNSDFHSEFESAGINQTRHKMFVTIYADVSIILPIKNMTITSSTDVLICENILVGQVPSTYLNHGSYGDYHLIPQKSLTN